MEMQTKELRKAAEFGTPLYVFHEEELRETTRRLENTLGKAAGLCYAMKANPFLVKVMEQLVDRIEVCSMGEFAICEEQAHVAYIPNGYITGLSKIARVVEAFSRRLQVQERLTNDIKNCIQNTLNPLGVAVVIEAQHMCMMMRGVQKQNSVTTTSDFSGAFEKLATREEFIRLISNKFH